MIDAKRLSMTVGDAMFTQRAYAQQERLPFELLADHWPHGAIARAYGVFDDDFGCALRGSFLLNTHLTVVWSGISPITKHRDFGALLAALPAAVDR